MKAGPHCEACHLDFQLDFANSIELIFRAHPEIRAADLGTYCIGGPAHSPHVLAQVRVAAHERIELELELPAGRYRLRAPSCRGLSTSAFRIRRRSAAGTSTLGRHRTAPPLCARGVRSFTSRPPRIVQRHLEDDPNQTGDPPVS